MKYLEIRNMMMTKIVHVNRNLIAANKKNNTNHPVLALKDGSKNSYGNQVDILDDDGEVVASLIYSPNKPLACGATCYLRAKNAIIVGESKSWREINDNTSIG